MEKKKKLRFEKSNEFTKTVAVCGHQGFVDNDDPNRSNNIKHP